MQRIGLLLLALGWLPLIFFGTPQTSRPIQAQGLVFAERLSAVQFPAGSAQLHQFRTTGLPWWLVKTPGIQPVEFCEQPKPNVSGTVKVWHPATVPAELFKAWQFKQKTALFPRQPCRA
jgi:hypothetical protein